jgi:chromosome segregation ATPase
MADLIERLQAGFTDWDGSRMHPDSDPMPHTTAGDLQEAADEIERLRVELQAESLRLQQADDARRFAQNEAEALKERIRTSLGALNAENERLRAELEECRRDARRYEWLRERHRTLCRMSVAQALGFDLHAIYVRTAEQFDEVLDAALAAQEQTNG